MTILLIEDEIEAANNLRWLVDRLAPTARIVGVIETVAEGIEWFRANPDPDLILSDIQLADGDSFELFAEHRPTCPVIFTTAYNEFAIRSFEVHSIDYLLKPIGEDALRRALGKFNSLTTDGLATMREQLAQFLQQSSPAPTGYRKSFLIRHRDKLIPLKTEAVAYFFTKEGLVYGRTTDDRQYVFDHTLEELEQQLSPDAFFRANRQFIISRDCLKEIEFYFNGRLLLKPLLPTTDLILISKERVPTFRRWFEAV